MGSVSAIFSGESPIHHRFLAIIRYLRLVAIYLCRWVGVFVFQFGWCWAVLREFVVLPPVEVVVLARFWRLGVVLVLVAEVMNGCGGVCSCSWFFVLESSKGLGA